MAVQERAVRWSVVPIENSIEGPVTATLDALAGEASDVRIVGELVLPVRQCLIARGPVELTNIDTVVSHPQAVGQSAAFLRERLPRAQVRSANSTAEAVRVVAEAGEPGWAALGPGLAASIYGCVVLCEGVEDRHDNETRFVWLARDAADRPPLDDLVAPGRAQKTSVVFWGSGAGEPGWLVACLDEFARREVNLTKIESRPQARLGTYMFFLDLDGGEGAPAVAQALAGTARALRRGARARVLPGRAVTGRANPPRGRPATLRAPWRALFHRLQLRPRRPMSPDGVGVTVAGCSF